MYTWVTLQHLVDWTSAKVQGDGNLQSKVPHINTDTRSLKKGEVYVALKGENFDGHTFIEDAVKKGALAVISEKDFKLSVPLLRVDNSLKAMAQIAQGLRKAFKGQVVAITGSAGKSSTKEMVAKIWGAHTLASPASFNNLLGVSRTLFLIKDDTQNLVLEMGMNALGEIAEMCQYFSPEIGVITNIGDAHLGKLGGKENIFKAKKELFDSISNGALLNIDDPYVLKAYQEAGCSKLKTVRYSALGKPADVSVRRAEMDENTGELSFSLEIKGQTIDSNLKIFGLHHIQNICAAVSWGVYLNLSLSEIEHRIQSFKPAYHRGEILNLKKGITLIDESYNSNPSALKSSLETLAQFAPQRRKVIVIGDMRELESYSEKMHLELGQFFVKLFGHGSQKIELFTVGEFSSLILKEWKNIKGLGQAFRNVKEAKSILQRLTQGDVLFLKGSRGVELDLLVTEATSLLQ